MSFAALDPDAPSAIHPAMEPSVEKTSRTGDDAGSRISGVARSSSAARAPDQQRARRVRRDWPAPAVQDFELSCPGMELPDDITVASTTFPVSGINLLENTAQSWYDAGYINVRRRYSQRTELLANYTWAKSLTDAPDFRSPMFESAIPQNNNESGCGKGAGLRYPPPLFVERRLRNPARWGLQSLIGGDDGTGVYSTIYQAQSGFPLPFPFLATPQMREPCSEKIRSAPTTRVSRYSDQALVPPINGSILPRSPRLPHSLSAMWEGIRLYGPGMQTIDLALDRKFIVTERAIRT